MAKFNMKDSFYWKNPFYGVIKVTICDIFSNIDKNYSKEIEYYCCQTNTENVYRLSATYITKNLISISNISKVLYEKT